MYRLVNLGALRLYLSFGGSYHAITVHYLSVLVVGEVCKHLLITFEPGFNKNRKMQLSTKDKISFLTTLICREEEDFKFNYNKSTQYFKTLEQNCKG